VRREDEGRGSREEGKKKKEEEMVVVAVAWLGCCVCTCVCVCKWCVWLRIKCALGGIKKDNKGPLTRENKIGFISF
jgi:hypothetical protein